MGTSTIEVSEFVEHIIQKFTLPKYPELKRHHLAEWELKDMRDTIEYICKAQRNACAREFNNYAKRHEYSNNCARVILKAKIERQDYENN